MESLGVWLGDFFIRIDVVIYWFLSLCLTFVIDMAQLDFYFTELIDGLVSRIYVIVGVFALFMLSYSLIKAMFAPDSMGKGKFSPVNLIKNLLIAIALVALMPTIFKYMYSFQRIVLDNNIIGNIILGKDSTTLHLYYQDDDGNTKILDDNVSPSTVGYRNYAKMQARNMSATIFESFFSEQQPDKVYRKSDITFGEKIELGLRQILTGQVGVISIINAVVDGQSKIITNGSFTMKSLKSIAVTTGNFWIYQITIPYVLSNHIGYSLPISTIVGLVCVVFAVSLCFDVVIRAFKLLLLQIISPFASLSLVIPNSKIFSSWLKETLKTFADLFLRLAIFNLMILIFSYWSSISKSVFGQHDSGIFNIVFIIGLLMFCKQAPNLVGSIFGFKAEKLMESAKKFGNAVKTGLFTAGGFVAGATTGALKGYNVNKGTYGAGWKSAWHGLAGGVDAAKAGKGSKNLSQLATNVKKSADTRQGKVEAGKRWSDQHNVKGFSDWVGKKATAFGQDLAGIDPTRAYKELVAENTMAQGVADGWDGAKKLVANQAIVKSAEAKRDTIKNGHMSKEQFYSDKRKEWLAAGKSIDALNNDQRSNGLLYKEYEAHYNSELAMANKNVDDAYVTAVNNAVRSGDSKMIMHLADINQAVHNNINNDRFKDANGNIAVKEIDYNNANVDYAAALKNNATVINGKAMKIGSDLSVDFSSLHSEFSNQDVQFNDKVRNFKNSIQSQIEAQLNNELARIAAEQSQHAVIGSSLAQSERSSEEIAKFEEAKQKIQAKLQALASGNKTYEQVINIADEYHVDHSPLDQEYQAYQTSVELRNAIIDEYTVPFDNKAFDTLLQNNTTYTNAQTTEQQKAQMRDQLWKALSQFGREYLANGSASETQIQNLCNNTSLSADEIKDMILGNGNHDGFTSTKNVAAVAGSLSRVNSSARNIEIIQEYQKAVKQGEDKK